MLGILSAIDILIVLLLKILVLIVCIMAVSCAVSYMLYMFTGKENWFIRWKDKHWF